MRKIILTVLFSIISTAIGLAAPRKATSFDKNRKMPSCVKLSPDCAVCSDFTKRKPNDNKKILGRILKETTDYACAAGKKSNLIFESVRDLASDCVRVSEYCSVCADNTFHYNQNQKKITSDLYACATTPRTVFFNP